LCSRQDAGGACRCAWKGDAQEDKRKDRQREDRQREHIKGTERTAQRDSTAQRQHRETAQRDSTERGQRQREDGGREKINSGR
jgi:hypothetical protein